MLVIFKIERKKQAIIAILLTITTLFITLGISSSLSAHNELLAYHAKANQDEFVIVSRDETALVISSTHSRKAAYATLDTLTDLGITKLDTIYFAHLSRALDENLEVLLANILIHEVHIPTPRNDGERAIVEKLTSLLEMHSARIVECSEVMNIRVGDYEVIPIFSTAYGEGTAQNAFFIHGGGDNLLYLSSGMMDKKTQALTMESIDHANTLIFGGHGKKHKSKIYFEADRKISQKLTDCVVALGGKALAGCIASGDQFVAAPEKKAYIKETFGAIACEMEGGAIAHVATVNGTPFAVLRAISDSADGDATMDYPTFSRLAAERSVATLRAYLRSL
jgi:beta-lactamase superfamily II metal-dependent hydrolase